MVTGVEEVESGGLIVDGGEALLALGVVAALDSGAKCIALVGDLGAVPK